MAETTPTSQKNDPTPTERMWDIAHTVYFPSKKRSFTEEDTRLLQQAIADGANVNDTNDRFLLAEDKHSILTQCLSRVDYVDGISFYNTLIKAGADLKHEPADSRRPMQLILDGAWGNWNKQNENIGKIIEGLIASGMDMNIRWPEMHKHQGVRGWRSYPKSIPLKLFHSYDVANYYDQLERLIKAGADFKDRLFLSELDFEEWSGKRLEGFSPEKMVAFLKMTGLIDQKDKNGKSFFDVAILRPDMDSYLYALIEARAVTTMKGFSDSSVSANCLANFLKPLVAAGVSPYEPVENGKNILRHYFADGDGLQALLEQAVRIGIDVTHRDADGGSLLSDIYEQSALSPRNDPNSAGISHQNGWAISHFILGPYVRLTRELAADWHAVPTDRLLDESGHPTKQLLQYCALGLLSDLLHPSRYPNDEKTAKKILAALPDHAKRNYDDVWLFRSQIPQTVTWGKRVETPLAGSENRR